MKNWILSALIISLYMVCGYLEKLDVDHQETVSNTPIPEQTVYVGEWVVVEYGR